LKTIDDILERLAVLAPDDTFSSKAVQKKALDLLNVAYGLAKSAFTDTLVRAAKSNPSEQLDALLWAIPFDLHQFRPKHEEGILRAKSSYPEDAPEWDTFNNACDALLDTVAQLQELREDVKETPVVSRPPKVENPVETAVRAHVLEIHKRRNQSYLRSVDLGRFFREEYGVRLPLSASSHYVVNQRGTAFLRTMYYLNGRRTSLDVILATLDTLEGESEEYNNR
jgi:hypothetical protein